MMELGKKIKQLRFKAGLTQEQLAEKLGIGAQSVSKWENAVAMPDITALPLLAEIFGVSIDDLLNYDSKSSESLGLAVPPKGKHIFGIVKVGDKGQIVLPAKARKIFDINPGDRLLVLGDEGQGLAIIKEKGLLDLLRNARKA